MTDSEVNHLIDLGVKGSITPFPHSFPLHLNPPHPCPGSEVKQLIANQVMLIHNDGYSASLHGLKSLLPAPELINRKIFEKNWVNPLIVYSDHLGESNFEK